MARTLHNKPQRSIEDACKHHVQYQTCPFLPSYMQGPKLFHAMQIPNRSRKYSAHA